MKEEKSGKDYLSPERRKKLMTTFVIKMIGALALLALAIFLYVYWNK